MAQQASISLKTVCKADELLLCLGPEFGNTGNMSTCGVLFGGDKCKTLRLVGKLSASLSNDLNAAKADSSSQVKVSHSLRVHNASPLSPRTRHWLSASHPPLLVPFKLIMSVSHSFDHPSGSLQDRAQAHGLWDRVQKQPHERFIRCRHGVRWTVGRTHDGGGEVVPRSHH